MDFQSACRTAEKWLVSTRNALEIIYTDTERKRIIFGSVVSKDTFYIEGPNIENGNTYWHLWSENDEVLSKLHPVIDSLQSCQGSTLTEILNKTARILLGATGDDDDDDEIEADMEDENDAYDAAYYREDDEDAVADSETKKPEDDAEDSNMYTKQGSPTAVKRLLNDWKTVKAAEKFGISASPNGNNLFIWDVKFKDIPQNIQLGRDLQEYAKTYKKEAVIHLEMTFPVDYPMSPPFIRIIRPRFQFLTGHVTVGGSICMEVLTRSGWRPTYDVENLLIQIRSEILSDPKASLDKHKADKPYDIVEARTAFKRMMMRYGWNK